MSEHITEIILGIYAARKEGWARGLFDLYYEVLHHAGVPR